MPRSASRPATALAWAARSGVSALLSTQRKAMALPTPFRCVLNKADTPERAAHASAVAGRLAERGIHSAITYYREEERGGLCWF